MALNKSELKETIRHLRNDIRTKDVIISRLEDDIKWLKSIHPSTSLALSEKERGKE